MTKTRGIMHMTVEPDVGKAVGLVDLTRKLKIQCPYTELDIYLSWQIFKVQPVPIVLMGWVDDIPVFHTEIRDLGSVDGHRIAGLSNAMVAEAFRHRGIYRCSITLKNILIDRSDFDCVVSRLKKGHEDHYMSLYPGHEVFLPEGPWGTVWCIRIVRPFPDVKEKVKDYLLKNKIRW